MQSTMTNSILKVKGSFWVIGYWLLKKNKFLIRLNTKAIK